MPVEEPPDDEPPPEEPPDPEEPPVKEPAIEALALDELERFLVLLFLRRYITYCALLRRFAATNGAAKLAKVLP